eukprot:IDg23471t1
MNNPQLTPQSSETPDSVLGTVSGNPVSAASIEKALIASESATSQRDGRTKFTRMTQEYTAYIAKISQSGRDGDDASLYNVPDFYEQMHELEKDKA